MVRPDEIVNMPRWKRKKVRVGKRRGHYNIEAQRSFSREELLDYLRACPSRTRDGLRAHRKAAEPNDHDYIKEFGSWGEALAEAFGRKEVDEEAEDRAMVEAFVFHKLWTRKRWLQKRKEYKLGIPNMEPIPSEYAVRRSWGCFTNLKWVAVCEDMEQQLNEYLRMTRRMGRRPSVTECKKRGLDISGLIVHFGSKKKLDNFLEGKWYEKGKRGQAKA